MEFIPINGQKLCREKNMRLGWCRLKTNGCAIIAIYNALGFLGRTMSVDEIVRAFHAWYRPHFFGISPRRLRGFFRHENIPFQNVSLAEAELKNGDIAVLTYWNRCFAKKFVNPFAGAHTVCIRYEGKLTVCNRFSNRKEIYRCDSLNELLTNRKPMQILLLKQQ